MLSVLVRKRAPVAGVVVFLAVVAGLVLFVRAVFVRRYTDPAQGTAVLAAAVALVGVLSTAAVTLTGLLLKQSVDRRNVLVAENAAVDRAQESRRLQAETAMQTVRLLTVGDGGMPAPDVQVSAALLVLAGLGEVPLAVTLASELWPRAQMTTSAAVRVLDGGLRHDDQDTRRSAAAAVLANVTRLDTGPDEYEWPSSLDSWDIGLEPSCRAMVALTLARWLRNRPASRPEDFRLVLLREARDTDPDPVVRRVVSGVPAL